MIYELRTYTLIFGATQRYFALYAERGRAIQNRFLGEPLGYFSTEIGTLNEIVHLWAYTTFEDRVTRRQRLWSDPDWQKFTKEIAPLIEKQESKLMLRAPFWEDQRVRSGA